MENLQQQKASIEVAVKDESLNYIIEAFFNKNINFFNINYEGDITIMEPIHVKASLSLTQAPKVEFDTLSAMHLSNEAKAYISQDFDLDILNSMPSIKFTIDGIKLQIETSVGTELDSIVKSEIQASVYVENGVLKAKSLSGKIYVNGDIDTILTFIADTLCKQLMGKIDNLPLPHFEKFYIDAGLKNVNIKNKELLTEIELTRLNDTIFIPNIAEGQNAAGAEIRIMADSDLIRLAASMIKIPGVSWTGGFDERYLTASITLNAGYYYQDSCIEKGIAEVRATIGLNAIIKVKVPLVPVQIITLGPNISIHLSAKLYKENNGKDLYMKLIPNFDTITIDWGLPGWLTCLTKILDTALRFILDKIGVELQGVPVKLITLDNSYQIFNTAINPSFTEFGFKDDKFIAKVLAK